ncbi:APC family permease [Ktedonosporobacter rubrisoli]|uniref:APC family permease n=1 Tax=Ktedonosporobacter rubrisoli TaxID=2509675 RepID=A0A4V0YYG7_KTERU|nr:APC family permease [Ktedonosporobacter rubrisoli]QBD76161.1 APC family permease [Ktedonosporobacter rubrisoli]
MALPSPDKPRRAPLPSEHYIPQTMPRVLTKWDLLAFYTPMMFLITNAVLSASGGVVGLTYTIVGAVLFFVPCVIATRQLVTMFPHEGSLYNWTYHALGSGASFFVGLCYWLSCVLAPVTSGNVMVTILQGINPRWLTEPWQQGTLMILILMFGAFLATQRLRALQLLIRAGAIMTVCAALLVTLSAIVWLISGHHAMTDFFKAGDWAITPDNFALFGIVTLNFIGASGPVTMAGEVRESQDKKKEIVRHLSWGSVLTFANYFLVTLAVLIIRGTNLSQDANQSFVVVGVVDMTLGKLLGSVTTVCVLMFCIMASILYALISSRLLLVASIDQRLPKSLAQLNKNRAPAVAIWFHTLMASILVVVIFIVGPSVIAGNKTLLATQIQTVVSAALTAIWTLATIFYFINLFFLWYKDRKFFNAQRIFPRIVLWTSIIVGTVTCILTLISIFVYPWLPAQVMNDVTWKISVTLITLFCLIAALIVSPIAASQADWEALTTSNT